MKIDVYLFINLPARMERTVTSFPIMYRSLLNEGGKKKKKKKKKRWAENENWKATTTTD